MPDPFVKRQAKEKQEAQKAITAESFRAKEAQSLTKSIGTAGKPLVEPRQKEDKVATTAFTPSVDMSSGGDEEARYSSSASSPVSGSGGGQATDIEEIPDLPNKLRSAIRRRRAKKLDKKGLRRASAETGLNIPTSGSGLGIPT